MSAPKEVLVVGAGVIGMATALTLADRGHRVTIIDSVDGPGKGTSFANGAQLSYAYTDALASPATLRQLPRLLLGADPAFRLYPRFDADFLRWGLAFIRNGSLSRFRHNTLAGLALALESRTALHRLTQRHGIEFSHRAPGKIHLFRTEKHLAAARAMVELKAPHGASQRIVEPDEAIAIEPALAALRDQIVGALHTSDEEVGDPYRFCTGAAAVLAAGGNASLLFGFPITSIDAARRRPAAITATGRRFEADHLILCAGTQSVRLARGVGCRLPIVPMKGYSITAPPGGAAPTVSVTDAANRVVFARLGSRMRIAGLADLGRWDTHVHPSRLAALVRSARAALPEAADYDGIESSWAGLRPMTPDSLPITRPIAPGVIANTGHGALGWTYAAGSAERVAQIIDNNI